MRPGPEQREPPAFGHLRQHVAVALRADQVPAFLDGPQIDLRLVAGAVGLLLGDVHFAARVVELVGRGLGHGQELGVPGEGVRLQEHTEDHQRPGIPGSAARGPVTLHAFGVLEHHVAGAAVAGEVVEPGDGVHVGRAPHVPDGGAGPRPWQVARVPELAVPSAEGVVEAADLAGAVPVREVRVHQRPCDRLDELPDLPFARTRIEQPHVGLQRVGGRVVALLHDVLAAVPEMRAGVVIDEPVVAPRVDPAFPQSEGGVDGSFRLGEAVGIVGMDRPHRLRLTEPGGIDMGVHPGREQPRQARNLSRRCLRPDGREHDLVRLGPADRVALVRLHLLQDRPATRLTRALLVPRLQVPALHERRHTEVELFAAAVAEQVEHDAVGSDLELFRVLTRSIAACHGAPGLGARGRCPVPTLLALEDLGGLTVPAEPLYGEVVRVVAEMVVAVLEHRHWAGVRSQVLDVRRAPVGARRAEQRPRTGAGGRGQLPPDVLEPHLVRVSREDERVRDRSERLTGVELQARDVPGERVAGLGHVRALEPHTGGHRPFGLDADVGVLGRGIGQCSVLVDHEQPSCPLAGRGTDAAHPDLTDEGVPRTQDILRRARVDHDLVASTLQAYARAGAGSRGPTDLDEDASTRIDQRVETDPLDRTVGCPASGHLGLAPPLAAVARHQPQGRRRIPHCPRGKRDAKGHRPVLDSLDPLGQVDGHGYPEAVGEDGFRRLSSEQYLGRPRPGAGLNELQQQFSGGKVVAAHVDRDLTARPRGRGHRLFEGFRTAEASECRAHTAFREGGLCRQQIQAPREPALTGPGLLPPETDRQPTPRLEDLGPGPAGRGRRVRPPGLRCVSEHKHTAGGRAVLRDPRPRSEALPVPPDVEPDLAPPTRQPERRVGNGGLHAPGAFTFPNRLRPVWVVPCVPASAPDLGIVDRPRGTDDELVGECAVNVRLQPDLDAVVAVHRVVAFADRRDGLAPLGPLTRHAQVDRVFVRQDLHGRGRLRTAERGYRHRALPGSVVEAPVDHERGWGPWARQPFLGRLPESSQRVRGKPQPDPGRGQGGTARQEGAQHQQHADR